MKFRACLAFNRFFTTSSLIQLYRCTYVILYLSYDTKLTLNRVIGVKRKDFVILYASLLGESFHYITKHVNH